MNPLNVFRTVSAVGCLVGLLLPGAARAKTPPWRYQFVDGVTNVYSLEIVVAGENGQEVTRGTVFIAASDVGSHNATLSWHATLHTENKQPSITAAARRLRS